MALRPFQIWLSNWNPIYTFYLPKYGFRVRNFKFEILNTRGKKARQWEQMGKVDGRWRTVQENGLAIGVADGQGSGRLWGASDVRCSDNPVSKVNDPEHWCHCCLLGCQKSVPKPKRLVRYRLKDNTPILVSILKLPLPSHRAILPSLVHAI
jgi:hypothetical protein